MDDETIDKYLESDCHLLSLHLNNALEGSKICLLMETFGSEFHTSTIIVHSMVFLQGRILRYFGA